VAPFPAPATSHVACGFPALSEPVEASRQGSASGARCSRGDPKQVVDDRWAYRTSADDGPPLYRTRPSATNGDKRAAHAVGQGAATAAYGVSR
jgi:hypothetical protein